MVFGTFRNPARFDGEVGFEDGASNRLGALLLGRDLGEEAGPVPGRSKSLPRARRPAAA
jgi:hypothetical protein